MTFADIVKTVTVPLDQDRAFTLFTRDLARWWPVASHSISAAQHKTPQKLDVDAVLNGRITETLENGQTTVWGHFSEWSPPHSFTLEWYVGRDADQATRVRVEFAAKGEATELTLRHDRFESLGQDGPDVSRSYLRGWDTVLTGYENLACN